MKQGFPRPLDPLPLLERWFAGNRRDLPWRRRHDLYGIWVSEVMLQQTRVETVVPYYRNFLMRFPSLGKLADASLQEVLKAWEGLGYYFPGPQPASGRPAGAKAISRPHPRGIW